MKIIVIGNGKKLPQQQDMSQEINSYDIVCRLNKCTFYHEEWTGTKTDILITRSATDVYAINEILNGSIPLEVIKQTKKLIVIGFTPHDTFKTGLEPYLKQYPPLQNIEHEFIPYDTWHESIKKIIKIPAEKHPTIGIVALDILSKHYPNDEIAIAGFSYQNFFQGAHMWSEEQRWVLTHLKIKNIGEISEKVKKEIGTLKFKIVSTKIKN